MNDSLKQITDRYPGLRVALVGDFCLDRYLEIDPARAETSIETGLAVHNVTRVRSQPGGAGTILNNLAALGVGLLHPVGLSGRDGEGFELLQSLKRVPGVNLNHFYQSDRRRTFTYTKPLLVRPDAPPEELNRLDIKNWSPTPAGLQNRIARALRELAGQIDALILLDQVDQPETGVITPKILEVVRSISRLNPRLLILADSRQSLRDYPPVCLKMNRAELAALTGTSETASTGQIQATAATLSRRHGKPVFVTLAEQGIVAAGTSGEVYHTPIHPVRGEIDIVGAGDAVTANLAAALAAGAGLKEALLLASAAASIVVHQLGTTGTATPEQILSLI